jgi:uncharacterized membrane protein YphA (DoxX/SURF4 family)
MKNFFNHPVTYRILLISIAVFFFISGYLEIVKSPATYPKTLKMGYPPYFIIALGISKIMGVIVLIAPSLRWLKEWVFAGFTFDVIFAFISTLAIASYVDCVKAVIVFCLVMLTHSMHLNNNRKIALKCISKVGRFRYDYGEPIQL